MSNVRPYDVTDEVRSHRHRSLDEWDEWDDFDDEPELSDGLDEAFSSWEEVNAMFVSL